MPALFAQDPLVPGARNGASRADAHPDSTAVADWRRVRRLHHDYGDRGAPQTMPGDGQGRRRNDVSVGFHVRQLSQEFVGNRKAGRGAPVIHADEHDAGAPVIGQIVRERADRLADPGRGVTA